MNNTVDQSTVRTKWLRSWKAQRYFNITYGILFLVITVILKHEKAAQEAVFESFMCSIMSFTSLFWLYVIHRCAYQKQGTKFLTWSIITGTLGVIKLIVNLKDLPSDSIYSLFIFGVYAAQIVIAACFIFYSMKLRGFNKALHDVNETPVPIEPTLPHNQLTDPNKP